MSFSFAHLTINRLIVHEVYKREDTREMIPPRFNNELTMLEAEGLNVLQSRIISALGSDSYGVQMEVSNIRENSTFDLSSKMLYQDDENFIAMSQTIANKLAEAQDNRRIPGGVVVIFDGEIGGGYKYLGIIKAEIHGGFTIDKSDTRILFKYISDLLLTPTQKLYKIGMFIETQTNEDDDDVRMADDFDVYVYDQNISGKDIDKAAIYFYNTFLGCSVCANNKKLTKDFYNFTKDFIDKFIDDSGEKYDLNDALYTYLKVSQCQFVMITEFAEMYLPEEKRDTYGNYMQTKQFPGNAIPKDISLLETKLAKRRMKFSTNISISGPSNKFRELVKIIESNNEKAIIEVMGKVKEQR